MRQRDIEQNRYKSFTRRAALVGAGQLALFGALAGRMYYLQVLESSRYTMLAEDNRINLRLLAPPRGEIVDRFGIELATNEQNYRVILVPEQADDIEATLEALSRYVDLEAEAREDIIRDIKQRRGFVPVTLREHLSWQEVSAVEVNAPDLPGINIEVGLTRAYPLGKPLAHVLGYVAAVSEKELTGDPLLELPGFKIGKNGIERRYEETLRGSAGASQVEVNAVGRVIRELRRQEGEPGSRMALTIDAALQSYAFGRLSGEESAAAVVMDVQTGDLLALTSYPSYDPEAFSLGISTTAWRKLVNDPHSPLTNKTIAGAYAPGSTFKMMTALTALSSGIAANFRAFCPGVLKLGNARFHCWKKGGHGWMDMHDGIKQSCDVYFYELAKRIKIDELAAMARRFGLGEETGIDLPGERAGLIPTRDWKQGALGEPWQLGETLVSAIGQGFVLATPLQLAVMAARIANGGRAVLPRLFRDPAESVADPETFEPLVPPEHLQVIQKAMDAVTNERRGTAYRARISEEGWEMAGKTGTSQVRRISLAERAAGVFKNEDLPWHRRDHALFVAYAPVSKPRYACSVVVEHGGGGSRAAAPIARDILREAQRRDPLSETPLERLAGREPEHG